MKTLSYLLLLTSFLLLSDCTPPKPSPIPGKAEYIKRSIPNVEVKDYIQVTADADSSIYFIPFKGPKIELDSLREEISKSDVLYDGFLEEPTQKGYSLGEMRRILGLSKP